MAAADIGGPLRSQRRGAAAARLAPGLVLVLGLVVLVVVLGGCASAPPGGGSVTDLVGRCSQTEEDGYREDARLDIRDGAVERLVWHIEVGRRGSCRFHLDQFRQTRSRPHIELVARDASGCKLLVYRDRRRITLGHAGCERQCTAGIVDDAWPVMFDPASGGCARLD